MSETSVRGRSTQRTSLRERQDVDTAGAVTIVTDCGSCAHAVRAALADAGLGPEVAGVEIGTAAGIRGAVLSVAESLERIDRELVVSAVDRDFLLLERVPEELASRVALLIERSERKRLRSLDADRLRSETIGLMWEIHTADSIAELAERVTVGARRVLNVHAAAVVIPADPDAQDASATPLLWRSPGGDSPELFERVAAFAARRATEAAASPTPEAWPHEKPVIDLVSEDDSDLVSEHPIVFASSRFSLTLDHSAQIDVTDGAIRDFSLDHLLWYLQISTLFLHVSNHTGHHTDRILTLL